MPVNEELTKLAKEIRDTISDGANMLRRLDHSSSLTISQLATLNALIDGPLPMSLLAEIKGVAQPTVSQHISRLENWGFVRRLPSPEDRRVILVEATEEGRAATVDSNLRRNSALATALEQLSPEEQTSLRDGIRCTRVLATILREMQAASYGITPPANTKE